MLSKINAKPAAKAAKSALEKPVALTPDQIQSVAGGMPASKTIRIGIIAR